MTLVWLLLLVLSPVAVSGLVAVGGGRGGGNGGYSGLHNCARHRCCCCCCCCTPDTTFQMEIPQNLELGLGWAGLGWYRQQTTKVQSSQGAGPWNISRHRAHWILDHTEGGCPQSVPQSYARHAADPRCCGEYCSLRDWGPGCVAQ